MTPGRRKLLAATSLAILAVAGALVWFVLDAGDRGSTATTPASPDESPTVAASPASPTSPTDATTEETDRPESPTGPPDASPEPDRTVPREPGPSDPDTTPPGADRHVSLQADGLGAVRFGEPARRVIATLTAVLGEPDDDTGFAPASQEQIRGACPPGRQRAVRWGPLTVGFLDGESAYSSRARGHFLTYAYGDRERVAPGRLRVDGEVALGATVNTVKAHFGNAAEFVPGDEIVSPYVRVDQGARFPFIFHVVDHRVTQVEAGQACS